MRFRAQPVVLALGLGLVTAYGQSPSLQKAAALELQGDFKGAARLMNEALGSTNISSVQRAQINFELDRLDRVRKDYPFTKDELFTALKKAVRDLTKDEFERWIGEGRFDGRRINGEQRFM